MKKVIITIVLINLYACNTKKNPVTKIIFHIKWANNKTFLLQQIPFKEAFPIVLDSAVAKGDLDSLVFTVPGTGEQLLKITAAEVNMSILFVTDVPLIRIYANYGNTARYSFEGSPASTGLKQFLERQDSIALIGTKLTLLSDSIKKVKGAVQTIDTLRLALRKNLAYFFNQYQNFEDTVRSPAAFMAIYNNVDFGNDYQGLKKFILKAASRFPFFQPIQQLKADVLNIIKIYEEEYQVGDSLPAIVLPDHNGRPFSTASLKGNYYLIDFWSTWCPQCMPYNLQKKKINKQYGANIKLVSVAIDTEKDSWKKLIGREQLNWIQLIDEKMWTGMAVNTLKFDSIPFNFLVSPQGRIVAKAIPPDSLLQVVSKYLNTP